MQRTAKQVTQHVVAGTTLRVVSDLAAGISGIVAAEQRVIRGLSGAGPWPHRCVTLFVLENLDSLVGQLHELHGPDGYSSYDLPLRPMVNLYDLANAEECFIFVNRQVMAAEGYWDDGLASEGLLAHEHAHPLAECPVTAASRSLKPGMEASPAVTSRSWAAVLARLAALLSVGAVSEVLANELCVRSGFGAALFHLDRVTMLRARHNLAQRAHLRERLAQAVAAGERTLDEAGILLLLADAQAHLPFALEVAPFFRSGDILMGHELESVLMKQILPQLEPEVASLYAALRRHYERLCSNWDAARLRQWCADVLSLLQTAVADRSPKAEFRLWIDEGTVNQASQP